MLGVNLIFQSTFLLLITSLINTERILVVSPIPIKSHVILNHVLVQLLLESGYKVTHITVAPQKTGHNNLRQIDVSSNTKMVNVKSILSNAKTESSRKHFTQLVTRLFSKVLQHDNAYKLLEDTKETFDLVIAEWLFSDMYTGLAALYDCPFIWFSSTEPHWMLLRTIHKDSASPNLIKDIYEKGTFTKIFRPLMAMRGKPMRSYEDMMSIASLVLVNSHLELSQAEDWPNGFKSIAGYHINENIKPLPKDLKRIMDNAKYGVIYFSFGSYMNGQDIPEEQIQRLINMFGGLKQTVLWKLELDFPRLPRNLYVLKWAPQQSILAHPNCILFITHGGILSKIESIHFGVPTIGIPIYGDQFVNIEASVMKGIAMRVDLSDSFAEDLNKAVVEMLGNPSYRREVKKLSSIYHNRTISPRGELLHWVNHTIRAGTPYQLRKSIIDEHKETLTTTLVVIIVSMTFVFKRILRKRLYNDK
ncbi:UDP-glucosyltransferase 2-like [Battus philenor]|uniref:UDP-glucosyltransferase 2-like n=1 Tax=Battus philenor TaxID=42288 RepID=UPI0035CEDE9D